MGQAYLIANIDKKEYIHPEAFNDGWKLQEFCGSSDGVLRALGMLTSNGNGRGGGDIMREGYESNNTFSLRPGEVCESEAICNRDHSNKTLPDGRQQKWRVIVPEYAGRWAGDRIITAGQYGDDDRFMTKVEQLYTCEAKLRTDYASEIDTASYSDRCYSFQTYEDWLLTATISSGCLFDCAMFRYTDIGAETRRQIELFTGSPADPEQLEMLAVGMLKDELVRQYQHYAGSKKIRGKSVAILDLSWMCTQTIDSFLIRWDTAKEFRQAKKWMGKQHMFPCQKAIIELYKFDSRPTDNQIRALSFEFPDAAEINQPGRFRREQLLPGKHFLQAAIRLENASKRSTDGYVTVDTPEEASLAKLAGVRVRETRAIDLTPVGD